MMILVNFKLYKETFGKKGVELAKIVKEVGKEYGIRTVVAASALEALNIYKETGVEMWLQNVDEYNEGRGTGHISSLQAMEAGIRGSLLNHSEHKIPRGKIFQILKQKAKGFEIMVCLASVGQMEKWTNKLRPDWVLYEPPKLIASKDKSVASEMSGSAKRMIEVAGKTPVIIGAGVKNKKDGEISLKIGAKGVGLSSAFVLAKDPKRILSEIADGLCAKI